MATSQNRSTKLVSIEQTEPSEGPSDSKVRCKTQDVEKTSAALATGHSEDFVIVNRARIFKLGEYPYRRPMSTTDYEALLRPLQAELVGSEVGQGERAKGDSPI
jgi:hypothetical protein